MKKDIEWLKKGIEVVLYRANLRGTLPVAEGNLIYDDIVSQINQLDEPEVLSREWIINNQERKGVHFFVNVNKLQSLVVPKKELPVIPKYVAEWYESEGKFSSWWNWFYKWGRDESRAELESKTIKWMQDYNEEKFVDMFRYGYEVEEEPLYYALIKGHELTDGYDIYWNCDKSDYSVFVSRLHPPHDNFLTEMSIVEWNKLGINHSNADFVKADE